MEPMRPDNRSLRNKNRARWVAMTGVFTALNIIMAALPIPTPAGNIYLCDMIICTAAILLDPIAGFVVGGIGSFIGDMLMYPAAMFVSLVTHGLQAVAVSLISHSNIGTSKAAPFIRSLVATLVGAVIMVIGYTIGNAYFYGDRSMATALFKFPKQVIQALFGAVMSLFLCYKLGLKGIFRKMELD